MRELFLGKISPLKTWILESSMRACSIARKLLLENSWCDCEFQMVNALSALHYTVEIYFVIVSLIRGGRDYNERSHEIFLLCSPTVRAWGVCWKVIHSHTHYSYSSLPVFAVHDRMALWILLPERIFSCEGCPLKTVWMWWGVCKSEVWHLSWAV